jgi:hypothetical protein
LNPNDVCFCEYCWGATENILSTRRL